MLRSISENAAKAKDQSESDGVARKMSCGGQFRQYWYGDRRVVNILHVRRICTYPQNSMISRKKIHSQAKPREETC